MLHYELFRGYRGWTEENLWKVQINYLMLYVHSIDN